MRKLFLVRFTTIFVPKPEQSLCAAYSVLPEFSVQLVVCYVSLNCSLSVCLEGKQNGRLATFDDIIWKQPIIISASLSPVRHVLFTLPSKSSQRIVNNLILFQRNSNRGTPDLHKIDRIFVTFTCKVTTKQRTRLPITSFLWRAQYIYLCDKKGPEVAGADTSYRQRNEGQITTSSTGLSYFNWPELSCLVRYRFDLHVYII